MMASGQLDPLRRSLMRFTLLICILGGFVVPAHAHYHLLLPQKPSAKRGEDVTFIYRWGHPYESQLFNATEPSKLIIRVPGDKKEDLKAPLEKDPDLKKVTGYRFRLNAAERGDYIIAAECPAEWMEEDSEFLRDSVKVILHVQAQKGWDTVVGLPFEMVPLTRPYGLKPGMVFQVQARLDDKPLAGELVEIERYNPTPPKELPPDEHITRTAKTDRNGVVTCTLTEPGWWCITAQRQAGTQTRNGKEYPVRQRSTLWVYVDEKTESGSK
jgi:cobalt/nickel transport protein